MITTLVQFQMSTPITLEDATRRFESSAPKYQNLSGLIRKYYVRSEDVASLEEFIFGNRGKLLRRSITVNGESVSRSSTAQSR